MELPYFYEDAMPEKYYIVYERDKGSLTGKTYVAQCINKYYAEVIVAALNARHTLMKSLGVEETY